MSTSQQIEWMRAQAAREYAARERQKEELLGPAAYAESQRKAQGIRRALLALGAEGVTPNLGD